MFFVLAFPAFADEVDISFDYDFVDRQTYNENFADGSVGGEGVDVLNELIVSPHDFLNQVECAEGFVDAMNGTIETFNLTSTTTRGRAAVYIVMAREFGLLTGGAFPSNRFDDVPMSSWYFPAVIWAANRQWILGLAGTNRFNPNVNVTRQEYAVMLVRTFSTPLNSGTQLDRFSDRNQIASWAVPYVRRAVQLGWIQGFPDGTFRPTNNITRQDAITMTNRTPGRNISDPTVRTITWNGNGGVAPGLWQRAQGHAIGPLPAPSRTNYTFTAWWTESAGGGSYLTTSTPLPNNNVTYWARWRPNTSVIMNYEIRHSTPLTAAVVQGHVNSVALQLWGNFSIDLRRNATSSRAALNQRSGCTLAIDRGCTSACGANANCRALHHRSRNHFMEVNRGTIAIPHFKFVDYRLCRLTNAGVHGTINGSASRLGNTIIVSTQSDNPRRTTAHEISHLFGARDTTNCTPNQSCVFRTGNVAHNHWCVNHRDEILRYRSQR